jgi:hypothetical protein
MPTVAIKGTTTLRNRVTLVLTIEISLTLELQKARKCVGIGYEMK